MNIPGAVGFSAGTSNAAVMPFDCRTRAAPCRTVPELPQQLPHDAGTAYGCRTLSRPRRTWCRHIVVRQPIAVPAWLATVTAGNVPRIVPASSCANSRAGMASCRDGWERAAYSAGTVPQRPQVSKKMWIQKKIEEAC